MPLLETGEIPLPNGNTLIWKPNEVGGREYWSTEIGGGVLVWDTAMVEESTIQAALNVEAMFDRQAHNKR
jgi:hypothetical protein